MFYKWKERKAKSRRDWRCKEENPCQSEEGALAWDRQLCLGQWQWTRTGWRQSQEIHRGERRAEGLVRLLKARGIAELSKVASGSATQGLWLRNGKVASQVIGIDRNRFPGKRTVWEIRRGGRSGREASDGAKKRVYNFWV